MVYIIDLIIIAIFLFFIYLGTKRGLILTLFNFVSFFASLLFSKLLYPVLSSFIINNKTFYNYFENSVKKSLKLDSILRNMTAKAQNDFINSLPLPKAILNNISQNNQIDVYKQLNLSSFAEFITRYLTVLLINIISMVLVFIIIFIAMKFISISLNLITSLPVIKKFNSAGGGIVGFLDALLFIWVIMFILTFFFSKNQFQNLFLKIQTSVIANKLYNYNLILKFITNLISG